MHLTNRTSNLGPGARSFTRTESAALAQRERASRRPSTPAERLKFKWFCIGVVFTAALYALIAFWVVVGGSPS